MQATDPTPALIVMPTSPVVVAVRFTLACCVGVLVFPVVFAFFENRVHGWCVLGEIVIYGHFSLRRQPLHFGDILIPFALPAALFLFAIFASWYYQAMRNAWVISKGLTHTPNGAWFGYWLPIYNFLQLWTDLNELWLASDPDELDDDDSWRYNNPAWVVHAWGVTTIAGSSLAFPAMLIETEEFWHAATSTLAASAALLSGIVKSITERQRAKYRKLIEANSQHAEIETH